MVFSYDSIEDAQKSLRGMDDRREFNIKRVIDHSTGVESFTLVKERKKNGRR